MSQVYFNSPKFKKFIPDWLTVIFLVILFFQVLEVTQPFPRQFYVNDPKLSHPFATKEQVTDNQLYLYSTLIPTLIIILGSAYFGDSQFGKIHLAQVSCLGLWFSVTITSVLTDILKCWISNPRPDFLERCGPKNRTPKDVLVGIDVCTSPLGPMYLADGLKSTPSGHSSMAFAGLLYLSLWFIGQLKLLQTNNKKKTGYVLVCCLPVVFAAYIGLSRTQDYRHHFFDVFLGSSIGVVFAVISYYKYFPQLQDENCNIPIDYDK
ncbi:DPP1 Diacylglycerol pyrophosphate phosphatase 1 [Candida maltosa Xu316]|uniref:Diacylglycerol pyrophosphate phosphatase 1, putative (Phosphatidate phosphatase, putative) n=1 Tax=Candida maltosa (strain Xu316) TaxID=1245528 RepID=M3IT21_CANMX|nr:Diacylglycerol pyrophosphate phosphatase 1, putative (Phosphatidate phosphatase, putative) [Candida maltosa Xu316]